MVNERTLDLLFRLNLFAKCCLPLDLKCRTLIKVVQLHLDRTAFLFIPV